MFRTVDRSSLQTVCDFSHSPQQEDFPHKICEGVLRGRRAAVWGAGVAEAGWRENAHSERSGIKQQTLRSEQQQQKINKRCGALFDLM
jgi:hypothetical protein